MRATGILAQARRERFAEITSGKAYFQQGLVATCKDLRYKGETKAARESRSGA